MQLRQSPSMMFHLENTRPINSSAGDTQTFLQLEPGPASARRPSNNSSLKGKGLLLVGSAPGKDSWSFNLEP